MKLNTNTSWVTPRAKAAKLVYRFSGARCLMYVYW
jgi:hypothetical protein